MEIQEKFGHCIYDPPSYKMEGFNFLRLVMDNFILMANFDSWVTLKEGFEVSKK